MLRKTWQFRELLYVLVRRDLLVRYQSSIFGFLWSFAQPLSMVLIFGIAFSVILRFETNGSQVPFGLHILVGILAWTLFQNAISEGHGSILGHSNLIKKVKMPVMIFPLVTVIGNLINFMLGMLVVFPILLIKMSGDQGIIWTQAIVQIVLFLAITALLLLFTLSLTLIVSSINVYYRDMASLSGVTMLAWFYTTPIVYPRHGIPPATPRCPPSTFRPAAAP